MADKEKVGRLDEANELIRHISRHGRRFFYSRQFDRVARFEMGLDGKVWFRDEYTDKRVYLAYKGRWRGFTNGGTLRRLVEDLYRYIRTGQQAPRVHLGPWASWVCDGDLWGYGREAMDALRLETAGSPCLTPPKAKAA